MEEQTSISYNHLASCPWDPQSVKKTCFRGLSGRLTEMVLTSPQDERCSKGSVGFTAEKTHCLVPPDRAPLGMGLTEHILPDQVGGWV